VRSGRRQILSQETRNFLKVFWFEITALILIHGLSMVRLVSAVILDQLITNGTSDQQLVLYRDVLTPAVIAALVSSYLVDRVKSNTAAFNLALGLVALGQLVALVSVAPYLSSANGTLPMEVYAAIISFSFGITLPLFMPLMDRLVAITDAQMSAATLSLGGEAFAYMVVAFLSLGIEFTGSSIQEGTLVYTTIVTSSIALVLLVIVIIAAKIHFASFDAHRVTMRRCALS